MVECTKKTVEGFVRGYETEKGIELPPGWTFLVHGTDKNRGWGDTLDKGEDIVINKSHRGLSCISKEERDKMRARFPDGAYDTTAHYAGKDSPAQVRVLLYKNPDTHNPETKGPREPLSEQTIEMVRKYYGMRHPSVPYKTKLLYIGSGTDEYTDMPVYYYVPEEISGDLERAILLNTGDGEDASSHSEHSS
jgi:hypothetical protein